MYIKDRKKMMLYLTRVQFDLLNDFISYKEEQQHNYKSEHIFNVLFKAMKEDVGFNEYVQQKKK